jgi:hypothetical protein
MLKHLIWEKKKDVVGSDWEDLEVGARALISRAPSGWAQIEHLLPIAAFRNDDDAFKALVKNGFVMTRQSVIEMLSETEEKDLPDWFGRAMSDDMKNQIPKRLKEKFPRFFGQFLSLTASN